MSSEALFFHEPTGEGPLEGVVVMLWHGAGGDVDQPHLQAVAAALCDSGALSVRARFRYRVEGRRMPDRMPKLLASMREAIHEVQSRPRVGARRLVLGGRSMGGRVASMLASENTSEDPPVAGLVFLSYPLHPAKQKAKLRDGHLPHIACPMLFVQGDRDALCDLKLLKPVMTRLGDRATLKVFERADHSFKRVEPRKVADLVCEWTSKKVIASPGPV